MTDKLVESDPAETDLLPASSCDDAVSKALTFARDTAKDEIESIERLHNRTLLALTIPLTVFLLLFSAIGWIGYSNLKRIAVSTATDVVKQRLDDQLTKQNIDLSVKAALQGHAASAISAEIKDQVNSTVANQVSKAISDMRPDIEASAKLRAQQIVTEWSKPRTLSEVSATALSGCMKKAMFLRITLAVGGDPEAQNYEKQIANALERGGWTPSEQALLGAHLSLPRYGLAIVTAPSVKEGTGAEKLQHCLQLANLSAPLILNDKPDEEFGEHTLLVVLPKPR